MKTRADYMAGRIDHDTYYRQFVTPAILSAVRKSIGVVRIANSTDAHMNDIPLSMWDALAGWGTLPKRLKCKCCGQMTNEYEKTKLNTFDALALFREAGEQVSCSTIVCTLKAAARQIKEEVTA